MNNKAITHHLECRNFYISGTSKVKIENSEGENGSTLDPMANDNNSGDRAICNETELKNLAQLVHDKWRKMVPKLGLTSEDEKLYEETNADEAGTCIIMFNKDSESKRYYRNLHLRNV